MHFSQIPPNIILFLTSSILRGLKNNSKYFRRILVSQRNNIYLCYVKKQTEHLNRIAP